jgi:hypothetical protein
LIILIKLGEKYKPRRSSLCSFIHLPVTSFLFGPNIIFSTLFSYILSICCSFCVRDQPSYPYRTTGNFLNNFIRHKIFGPK